MGIQWNAFPGKLNEDLAKINNSDSQWKATFQLCSQAKEVIYSKKVRKKQLLYASSTLTFFDHFAKVLRNFT